MTLRLGVNIDHVATLRQARGGVEPNLLEAARQAQAAGADGITVHLREDRRHIQDADVFALRPLVRCLNLEMAVSPEIVAIALRLKPDECCLVPEKRQELTTEGGLDVARHFGAVRDAVAQLQLEKIQVSLFIDPTPDQVTAAANTGADAIELHTGEYANAEGAARDAKLRHLIDAAAMADDLGLQVNAGHGLNYTNVQAVVAIPQLHTLNIGHSIIARAVFVGLRVAVEEMWGMLKI
jgi:pyridoxine 5-phosphate synthase